MNRVPHNGQFFSNVDSIRSTVPSDLPRTTLQTIELFQAYGILPSEFKINKNFSVPLIPKVIPSGDKINDGFKLYNPMKKNYEPIRPVLSYNDKYTLRENLEIFYFLANDIAHKEVAGFYGGIHYKEDRTFDVNNAPVTRMRSNVHYFFVFFYCEIYTSQIKFLLPNPKIFANIDSSKKTNAVPV